MAKKKKFTSAGLGDSIKKFTTALGVTPCTGCNRRSRYLNKAFPYNTAKGEMTKDQFDNWKVFKDAKKKIILDSDMDLIEDTYNAINHTAVMPCRNCGGTGWLHLVKTIDKTYNLYL
jgi:hypothetical protein